jgi:hypothetical protein
MSVVRRALTVSGLCLLACARESAPPPPPAPAPVVLAPAATDALAPTTTTDPLPDPEPPLEEPRPDAAPEMVTIKLLADQRAQAHVFWGRKELGIAPLEVMRPRGSGPLDLLVLAEGYLPLHTRAFTDRSETLALRLVPTTSASGLPGYSPPATAEPGLGPAKPDLPRRETSSKNPGIKPTTKAKPESR